MSFFFSLSHMYIYIYCFIVAIGENYLNSLHILTRFQNILTFNCHLLWLCIFGDGVVAVVLVGFFFFSSRISVAKIQLNGRLCRCECISIILIDVGVVIMVVASTTEGKKNHSYALRSHFLKWNFAQGRKKLLKASMR